MYNFQVRHDLKYLVPSYVVTYFLNYIFLIASTSINHDQKQNDSKIHPA